MKKFFHDCKCGASWDSDRGNRCPNCHEFHFGNRRLVNVGTGSKHICDSRCTNAKGRTCNCACNGKNHGLEAA